MKIYEDPRNLSPLTPAMFLFEKSESKVTDFDKIDAKHCRQRIRFPMKLLEQLRRRFRKEYLRQLIQKRKEQISIKVGDMVFIGDDFK
ncbi:uncharacterized protein NPIL_178291 [Nephila pilipes]|uniref:Uncharacterized protein n=1 Tax=Nephila pilipes TaxID=299642 RepID=A0A8X6N0N4_NEPPI|nr:uncharacterized protein NPIL_178291 [Nephila pilipes]